MKRNTKLLIADGFIEKVSASSLARLRIADLIDALDINRNTFYYHFSSKYDVAMWIFRRDLATELYASFPDDCLVKSLIGGKEDDSPSPYYVHVEIGAHMLDFSGFLKALVRCTAKREEFYRRLFATGELEFASCVTNLFYPAVRGDIDFILGGRYMPQTTRHMLSTLYTRSIVSLIGFCLESDDRDDLLDDRTNPFWNMIQESLHDAIQAHPINRYLRKPRHDEGIGRSHDVPASL